MILRVMGCIRQTWDRATLAEELTSREMEVLRPVAGGLSSKEIARRLNVSEHTGEFHLNALKERWVLRAGRRR